MRDSEKKLKTLFALSREPILGVRDGIIVFANAAAVSCFNDTLESKAALDFIPSHILSGSSEGFAASAKISGRSATVTATHMDDLLLLSITLDTVNDRSVCMAPPAFMHPLVSTIFNIKMCIDLISRHVDVKSEPKLEQYLSILYHNHYAAVRLTNNLQTLSDLHTGSIVFKPVSTNAASLCAELVDTVRHLTASSGVELKFECDAEVIPVNGDERLLNQMLLNLLSNSLLHTKAGGTITLSLRSIGQSLTVMVDDTGDGISPEVMSEVFVRFDRQADLANMAEGAGFGLAIAKGIAELHGGAMIIESRQEIGTSVRVMLPLDDASTSQLRDGTTGYGAKDQYMYQVLTELSSVLSYREYNENYLD